MTKPYFMIIMIIIASLTGSCWGQCNGPPLILMPNNSTGNLAFPESNLDPMTGIWHGDHFYPVNVNCTWILRAPPAHVINIRFLNFNTEEKFDFVTIYSSEDRINGSGLFQFSGELTVDWVAVTPDNYLVMDFVSDEFHTYEGFQLAYRYMPKACVPGGVITKESQLIALPPWNLQGALPGPSRPEFKPMVIHDEIHHSGQITSEELNPKWVAVSNYPQGLNCTWQIDVETRNVIEIEFLQFHMNPSDFVQIWKIEGERVIPFTKFWEGQQPNAKIISSSSLLMNFISAYGAENIGTGFLLNVTFSTRACSKNQEEITSPRGYLAYPKGNFERNLWKQDSQIHYGPDNCTWVITAPKGYVINITIEEIDKRPEDQMEIIDNNKPLIQFSESLPNKRYVISDTNKVIITFQSATESENSGFLLHYSWVLNDCQYELPPDGGEIRSPYYPDTYGSNLQCQWILAPTARKQIVHFVMLRLQLDEGDFLQMSDGKDNILLTSQSHPLSKIEFSSVMPIVVNFISDSSLNRGYFFFKYTIFEPGICDFSLTTCGWKSLDPFHAWTLDEKNGVVFAEESQQMLLPRGYKSQLVSQILEPEGFDDDKSPIRTPMCLEFEYLIKGSDAYQLNVAVESKNNNQIEVWNERSSKIYEINGPHGNEFLWTAINFTVSGYFRVIFSYERGYGPDYLTAIDSVKVKKGHCVGSRISDLYSFKCIFNESFCGWKNTHSDQHNWQLGNQGISAMDNITVNERSSFQFIEGRYVSQFADLISPVMISADIFKFTDISKPVEDCCLRFNYQIFSPFALMKILISPTEHKSASHLDQMIWSGGKFSSGKILSAEIPLNKKLIPDKFQIIIRGLSTKPHKFNFRKTLEEQNGLLLKNISLESGKCFNADECTFTNGFCTWTALSSGQAAWQIREDETNNSFAAVSEGNGGVETIFVSPRLIIETPRSLKFRYKINSLENQCIQVAIKKGAISDSDEFNVSSNDIVLWEQCKDKGQNWLHECIDLPFITEYSHIIISAKFMAHFTSLPIVWLDDIRIVSEECYVGKTISNWNCSPEDSLCGLTQSLAGFWQWVFVENKEKLEEKNHHSGFSCLNGDIVDGSMVCNGFPDCKSAEDETNCENKDYAMSDTAIHHVSPNFTSPVTCADGRELSVYWLCDGIQDCLDGSDEVNCECKGRACDIQQNKLPIRTDTCDSNQFKCYSGAICHKENCMHDFCIDKRFVCDGTFDCNSREDESDCLKSDFPAEAVPGGNDDRMECSNGLLIPNLFRCDGMKDCPLDGKDEVGCHHCGEAEFLCPKTGVCLPWPAVCDGDSSIDTCTDEDFCHNCPMGYFACDVCLESHQICDGIWDCMEGEDEQRCVATIQTSMPMSDSPMKGMHPKQYRKNCQDHQFQCSSGTCISLNSICNRIPDCEEGDDEFNCLEDNFEKLRYISAKGQLKHYIYEDSVSYLTTPILTLLDDSWGLLSFQYRLDSWIGPANISLSIEITDISGNESLIPSSLWRQSGHKGEFWIKEHIIVPKMKTSFKISFVVAGTGIGHHSEKIHISDLSFKSIGLEDIRKLEKKRMVCYFEESWCGWSQTFVQNGYSWIRTVTSPHSRRTGPLAGFSDGKNSGFLLADSLHGQDGDSADLISPALFFPKDLQCLCLRLMVFMYGSNVAGLSVHTQQRFSGHIFSKQLLKIAGAQGLSWIPVNIDISSDQFSDPDQPFFLVIRATRGQGPESDVAVDQVELSSGTCGNRSDNYIFFTSVPKHSDMYVLKAGLPTKPYINNEKSNGGNTTDALEEYCSSFQQCSTCVSSEITMCSWCGEGHFCILHSSPRAKICSQNLLISHTNISTSVSGAGFCPRIIKDKNDHIYVPNYSSPILRFSVENIQKFHSSDWLCRYNIPQANQPEGQIFEDEMAFLQEFKSPDVDSEFLNLLQGFAVAEQKSKPGFQATEVKGYFQPSTSMTNNTHQRGIVTCGNGESNVNIPEGESVPAIKVSIITPVGNELDNPDDVRVTIYNCQLLAMKCEECVSVNISFDCGWCSVSSKCLLSTECPHGRWSSHQPESVCKMRTDLDILSELLSSQDSKLESDLDDLMMDTEEAEFYEVSNVKKKVGKNLRKSLQSRRARQSKVEEVENTRNKKRSRGKSDKKRKSDENRKRDKGSKRGRKKSFLKVPFDASVYIARNMWRLHTGKQYYIPVKKKFLLNLEFVRQVNYGDLNNEKPRTVLIDGKWKKAVGFFVDLFENAEDDPVTSIITTKKEIFDQLLRYL